MSTKSNHSQKSNTSSIKKDIMLFCMGLVTGGTLIGVGKKMFNKWVLNYLLLPTSNLKLNFLFKI